MRIAVCFNKVPQQLLRGEIADRISEEGAADEAEAVRRALQELGHQPFLVAAGDDPVPFMQSLQRLRPELIFNLCEGFWGESRKEMHVAALYELLDLPFTGSAPLTLGLTQDKLRTKDLLAHNGLPTPPYCIVHLGSSPVNLTLQYPLFVKPRQEDASLGINNDSIVHDPAALCRRVAYIHDTYCQDALVEEYIDGREFNVALLGNNPPHPLPVAEIVFAAGLDNNIVTYDGKWKEESGDYLGTVPVCPAPLDASESAEIQKVALRAYQLMQCRDYARIDIRLRDGVPYILEVNANPDISPGAGLARAAKAAGIHYPQLVENILRMAQQRKEITDAKPQAV
jgi:D-alanine-D-alanine ligase